MDNSEEPSNQVAAINISGSDDDGGRSGTGPNALNFG